jgi:predicted anti-sigma-YlaC factor YlaD
MTICNDVQSQLSLIVDGQQPERAAQALVRSHLETCAACRGALQDLERLRRAAASLGPMTPPDHVWLEVAGQIRLSPAPAPAETESRRESSSRRAVVQWLGLAAALVLVTLGYYAIQRASNALGIGGNVQSTGTVEAVAEELNLATEHYEKAVTELEALAKSDAAVLDPAIAATLKQNIDTIDVAIAESRTALSQNPGSEPARASLFEALRRKVGVLQATVTLMNEMRKGNQAGAAEAAAAFGKKS